MKTHVEFRSAEFPPYDGEEDEINPGRYGKRVAELLVRGLAEKGFEPVGPIPADWGWIVQIKNDDFRMWIGCGNYDEYPDGFLCFIEPHQPVVHRFIVFGRRDTTARVGKLQQAIDEVLSAAPSVKNKRWWSYEEFNTPGSRTEHRT